MVRAGASPRALQIEVCQRFEERGHGSIRQHPVPESGYLHALGHGLGLELHEAPLFRHYETDAEFPLEAGMVLTFEPGLYYPGEGMAVRLEDTILVRPEGPPEILAPYPLEIGLSLANA